MGWPGLGAGLICVFRHSRLQEFRAACGSALIISTGLLGNLMPCHCKGNGGSSPAAHSSQQYQESTHLLITSIAASLAGSQLQASKFCACGGPSLKQIKVSKYNCVFMLLNVQCQLIYRYIYIALSGYIALYMYTVLSWHCPFKISGRSL